MRCPRCDRDNPDDNRFCGACGSPLTERAPDERVLKALELMEEGQAEKAKALLERVGETDPWHRTARRVLGGILYRQGQIETAASCFRSAGEDGAFVDAWYDLGVALYHSGDVQGAATAYRKVLELDPTYHAAHYRLGITLYHLGKLEEALKTFEKAQLLTPEYAMASYHIGVLLGRLGRFDEAKTQLESYLEYHPWDAPTKYHLGMLSARAGDRDAAERYFNGLPEFRSGIPEFPG